MENEKLNERLRKYEKRVQEINEELEDLILERKILEYDIYQIKKYLRGEIK